MSYRLKGESLQYSIYLKNWIMVEKSLNDPADIRVRMQCEMVQCVNCLYCKFPFLICPVSLNIRVRTQEIFPVMTDHGIGKPSGRKFRQEIRSAEKHNHPQPHSSNWEKRSSKMALGQIVYFGLKISLCTLYPAYTTFKMMKEGDEMVGINFKIFKLKLSFRYVTVC